MNVTPIPQSLRVSIRALQRAPGFAVTAVLTLGLGIGLATAVFTVAQALILRRLPVRDQDRLVLLAGETPDKRFENYPLQYADAREFERRTRSLERVGFYSYYGAIAKPIRDGDRISQAQRSLVSGEFFDVLGARPVLGRALRASDDVRGAAPVAVLSHRAWQERFAGDTGVVGRQMLMYDDRVSYTIVGVMPQGLEFPKGTDFWAPVLPLTTPAAMEFVALNAIGRLAPRATPADARNEMTAFLRRPEAPPSQRELRGTVSLLPRVVLGDTKPALLVFACAAGLLLLITCVNVANLLLVRGMARTREIAVRSALGAGRGQIIAQLLAENALLAVVGGVAGFAVAAGAVQAFIAFAPAGTPRLDEIRLDASVLIGAAGITGVAMLVFALAPALLTSRVEVQEVLRSGTRQSAGRRSRLATELLVAGQVALALLVLSASGLIMRSLINLQTAKLSFDGSHLLIGGLTFRVDQFDSRDKQVGVLDQLVTRLEAVPGVGAVTPIVAPPFAGTHGWDGRPAAEGQSRQEAAANPMLNMEVVAPNYFATFDIPLLRGRSFTVDDREGAPVVAIVSASAARHYWPNDDPIGKRLLMGPKNERVLTVVGVVPDTRYRDLRDARASIYFALRQPYFPFAPTVLAIRANGAPADLVPALRRAIGEHDAGVALASVAPFETLLDGPLAQPRLNALLLAVFAGAAVTLAAIGLFGVMATMVRQRTREMGVRMALGATAHDLRRLVMRRGLAIASTGIAVGLGGSVLANRLLLAMLYEISPTDGITLVVVSGLLFGVAILASAIPARTSTRIDPMIALRADG